MKRLLKNTVLFIALAVIFGLALSCGESGSSTETEINEIAELEQKLKDKDKEIEDLNKELSIVNYQLSMVREELDSKVSESKELEQAKENTEADIEAEPEEEAVEEPVEEDPTTTETSPGETDSATLGEKNAAKSALDYLAYTPFSYSGLVEQLKFEGYTHEEAVYGVDKCGADWNEQAALMAEDYLNYSSFSRTELIAQLEFEGFTRQQAEYGVQAVGY